MKRDADIQAGEPVGIVISRGAEPVRLPRFSAFVYAPSPDDVTVEIKAA